MSNYDTSCRHYQLLTGTQNETRQKLANLPNRRNSIRVPNRRNFSFFEITSPDQYPGSRDNDAYTIDLGTQGIRFASRLLLKPDTAIRFSLETDDTAEKVEGTGKVVWCEPLKNTPLYHVGIMFNWPRNTLDKKDYFVPSAKMDALLKGGFRRGCESPKCSNIGQNNNLLKIHCVTKVRLNSVDKGTG